MKNTLFTTIALLTSIPATYSQSYRPFVQEGSTWALEFAYEAYTLSDYMLLRIEGDTIYDGKSYKKMMHYPVTFTDSYQVGPAAPMGILREENKVVYGILQPEFNGGHWFCHDEQVQSESVLFDFNSTIGDIYTCGNMTHKVINLGTDIINGISYNYIDIGDYKVYQEIGGERGPFISSLIHSEEGFALRGFCNGDFEDCFTELFPGKNQNTVSTNKRWTERISSMISPSIKSSHLSTIKPPVNLGGLAAFPIDISNDRSANHWEATNSYLREENHKVYLINNQSETLLYDFSLDLGDTFNTPINTITVIGTDSVTLLDGKKRKRLLLTCQISGTTGDQYTWIEGLGDPNLGLLAPLDYCTTDYLINLSCFYENEVLVYSDPASVDCWVTPTLDIEEEALKLYPNPTAQLLMIAGPDLHHTPYCIQHMLGNTIQEGYVINQSIDLTPLQPGTYLIQIEGYAYQLVVKI